MVRLLPQRVFSLRWTTQVSISIDPANRYVDDGCGRSMRHAETLSGWRLRVPSKAKMGKKFRRLREADKGIRLIFAARRAVSPFSRHPFVGGELKQVDLLIRAGRPSQRTEFLRFPLHASASYDSMRSVPGRVRTPYLRGNRLPGGVFSSDAHVHDDDSTNVEDRTYVLPWPKEDWIER